MLTGSVVAMLIGYQTRFLAVSLSFVQSGFQRIHRNIDDAARTLGSGPGRSLVAVHLPLSAAESADRGARGVRGRGEGTAR